MADLSRVVESLRADLDEHDRLTAQHHVPRSLYVEVQRTVLVALLEELESGRD